MLDWQTILWCHARVPVYYWPMLWYWLGRLSDTYLVYGQEGRRFFRWYLMRDGRIWVEYRDESDAERAARGARHRLFDRTPWTRLAPFEPRLIPGRRPARLAACEPCTTGVLLLYRWCTVTALPVHPARAPP